MPFFKVTKNLLQYCPVAAGKSEIVRWMSRIGYWVFLICLVAAPLRAQGEFLRASFDDGSLHLLAKGLVEPVGSLKAVGHPRRVKGFDRLGLELHEGGRAIILDTPIGERFAIGFYLKMDMETHSGRLLTIKNDRGLSLFAMDINRNRNYQIRTAIGASRSASITLDSKLARVTWQHVLVEGNGSYWRLFINGNVVWEGEIWEQRNGASQLILGKAPRVDKSAFCFIDNLAITLGSESSGRLLSSEPSLLFQIRLLSDMKERGYISRSNTFYEPTVFSTSLLRLYIAELINKEDRQTLPLDRLESLDGDYRRYVYSGNLNLQEDGFYTSLYLNFLYKKRMGYCGSMAMLLWAAARAFGFESYQYDFINKSQSDSHAMVDVFIVDKNRLIMQDATFNLGGIDKVGKTYSALDLHQLALGTMKSKVILQNSGFSRDHLMGDGIGVIGVSLTVEGKIIDWKEYLNYYGHLYSVMNHYKKMVSNLGVKRPLER